MTWTPQLLWHWLICLIRGHRWANSRPFLRAGIEHHLKICLRCSAIEILAPLFPPEPENGPIKLP
jgi:hypothetical protein